MSSTELARYEAVDDLFGYNFATYELAVGDG